MISNLALIVIGGIKNSFVVPIIVAMKGNKSLLLKLLSKIYILTLVIVLSAYVILYFLSPTLLRLYGIHFNSVLGLLPFALIANIPMAIISGDVIFINYLNSYTNKLFTYITVAKCILTVFFGLILINYFYIYGAIATYIIVEFMSAGAIIYLKHLTITKINDMGKFP